MVAGSCPNRSESSPMDTKTRSLVLLNYFPDNPNVTGSCKDNSAPLISMVNTCYEAAGKRWPNFISVDFYQVGLFLFLCNYQQKVVFFHFSTKGLKIHRQETNQQDANNICNNFAEE